MIPKGVSGSITFAFIVFVLFVLVRNGSAKTSVTLEMVCASMFTFLVLLTLAILVEEYAFFVSTPVLGFLCVALGVYVYALIVGRSIALDTCAQVDMRKVALQSTKLVVSTVFVYYIASHTQFLIRPFRDIFDSDSLWVDWFAVSFWSAMAAFPGMASMYFGVKRDACTPSLRFGKLKDGA